VTRLLLACLAVAGVVMTSGCNATKRELVVVFASSATPAQHAAALHACAGAAAHATPEPMPTAGGRVVGSDVRFRIDAANDRDIAKLESCLQRQAGVQGFQDSSDSM
jgi:hypothetical protein